MKRASSENRKVLKILKEMESLQVQYPEELFSSRRASFLEQVEQSTATSTEEQASVQDQRVIDHLKSLGSVPASYPPVLLAARRSAFVRRIARLNFIRLLAAVWLVVQKWLPVPSFSWHRPVLRRWVLPTSLLATSLALAAFAGYLVYENQNSPLRFSPRQYGTVHSGQVTKADAREVRIICKPGARPPLCLAGEYKNDDALAYQGNGLARPAVAKDTLPAAGKFHKAAYINDGLYGPAASWISNSRNSWIKIDLGKVTKINTVTFGRDRLGKLSGHNPGQFVVSLALADDVYADGNNSNDNREYKQVFNSKQTGFSGTISGADTVIAQFAAQETRYIKITFENKGAAIDEVEAFMAQPPVASSQPNTTSRDEPSTDSSSPGATSTIRPSVTVTSPVNTATSLPTITVAPSETATPIPTATEIPSNTPVPTSTSVPTSTPVPTDTSVPVPSNTPLPPPTSTPLPPDTDTPVPTEPPLEETIYYYEYLTSIP